MPAPMKVYIAGPISGKHDKNRTAFDTADYILRLRGYEVVNPLDDPMDTWQDNIVVDLQLIQGCDAIALLEGWESSYGALIEVLFAEKMGKAVLGPTMGPPFTSIHPGNMRANIRGGMGLNPIYKDSYQNALCELEILHNKKAQDYGDGEDQYANMRVAEEFGDPPSKGAAMRASDKLSRLKTYYKTGQLACEGVEDSYLDLANYAIIGLLLFREEREHGY